MAQGDFKTGRLTYTVRAIYLSVVIGTSFLLLSCQTSPTDDLEPPQTPAPSNAPTSVTPASPPAVDVTEHADAPAPQQSPLAARAPSPIVLPKVIELPGGRFWQGDHSQQGLPDERPVVEQNLAPFAITVYEISVWQYGQFLTATGHRAPTQPTRNPASATMPVVGVSWTDAQAFAAWLSRASGQRWRLPSEAEWEYAARAGSYRLFQTGNDPARLCEAGHVADCDEPVESPQPVGKRQANAFGLFDIHGNVWEWTGDCYHRYTESLPVQCTQRVTRGGSFRTPANEARFSRRQPRDSAATFPDVGFRLVLDL